jgi:biopolymer transport protein ExbD
MPKVKVPRKSTTIDMTAMCDVAFLLLSFFILTTKFKPSDALSVVTPKSVATKAADQKNVVLITVDHEGHTYFSLSDENISEKEQVINSAAQMKGITLTDQEKAAFKKGASYVGVPFSQLASFLRLNSDQLKAFKSPGIPTDSTNNELLIWIRAAQEAFKGGKMNVMLKGDNKAKYPAFKAVIDALKKSEIFKFSLITDPEGVPKGSELEKKNNQKKA